MVISEGSGITTSFINKHISLAFDNLTERQLESLYSVQTDDELTLFFKQRLLAKYQFILTEKKDKKISRISSLILSCYLDMTEDADKLIPIRKEAVNVHLKKYTFDELVKIYDELMEEEDDYQEMIVNAFSEIIVEMVSNKEPLYLIEKACNFHDDYCWKQIGSRVEKKLGITFG